VLRLRHRSCASRRSACGRELIERTGARKVCEQALRVLKRHTGVLIGLTPGEKFSHEDSAQAYTVMALLSWRADSNVGIQEPTHSSESSGFAQRRKVLHVHGPIRPAAEGVGGRGFLVAHPSTVAGISKRTVSTGRKARWPPQSSIGSVLN